MSYETVQRTLNSPSHGDKVQVGDEIILTFDKSGPTLKMRIQAPKTKGIVISKANKPPLRKLRRLS